MSVEYLIAGSLWTWDGVNWVKAGGSTSGGVVSEVASGSSVELSTTLPADLGVAAVGVGTTAARADHVHAEPQNIGGLPYTLTSPQAGDSLTISSGRWVNSPTAYSTITDGGNF